MTDKLPVALTIAGSDSGGGAGIQADLRAFTKLHTFGTTAITCITAQNPDEVRDVQPIEPALISTQIKTICDFFPVKAAKTGMLFSEEIINSVAETLETVEIKNLVVDPVMVATSGVKLLQEDAIDALCSKIIPKAMIITPNVPELEILSGRKINSIDDMKAAAELAGSKYNVAVAAKGGHLNHDDETCLIDILFDNGKFTEFLGPRLKVNSTHGTGCSFAAAMAACLAQGHSLEEAMPIAKDYVADYIRLQDDQ
ncbi:bifunctional hydroxymethylpyrimidine kinase/phosphomethylpyrimidine kinase [bacterium E08(2017)]|nr:bifunctional hydroxymethylpyrimidine kinase/phosphomethylpyrimidine kinase [bacterium E08(2017)]